MLQHSSDCYRALHRPRQRRPLAPGAAAIRSGTAHAHRSFTQWDLDFASQSNVITGLDVHSREARLQCFRRVCAQQMRESREEMSILLLRCLVSTRRGKEEYVAAQGSFRKAAT